MWGICRIISMLTTLSPRTVRMKPRTFRPLTLRAGRSRDNVSCSCAGTTDAAQHRNRTSHERTLSALRMTWVCNASVDKIGEIVHQTLKPVDDVLEDVIVKIVSEGAVAGSV